MAIWVSFVSQWDPMIPTPQDEKPRGDALVEDEVKQLIIDVVQLEDITPADIDTDAPLFVDGLGLDSIDALERGWLSISVMGYPCRAMRFVATIVASLLTLFDPCLGLDKHAVAANQGFDVRVSSLSACAYHRARPAAQTWRADEF
jgi:hypothetical protein